MPAGHTEARGQQFGISEADVGRELRGQCQRLDIFRAEGVHGDAQGKCRIDAAGKPQHGPAKMILVRVVAHAQHQCRVIAGVRRRRRLRRQVGAQHGFAGIIAQFHAKKTFREMRRR